MMLLKICMTKSLWEKILLSRLAAVVEKILEEDHKEKMFASTAVKLATGLMSAGTEAEEETEEMTLLKADASNVEKKDIDKLTAIAEAVEEQEERMMTSIEEEEEDDLIQKTATEIEEDIDIDHDHQVEVTEEEEEEIQTQKEEIETERERETTHLDQENLEVQEETRSLRTINLIKDIKIINILSLRL